MRIKNRKAKLLNDKGFTLVEIAVVMLISSFLFAITFKAYSVVLDQSEAMTLYENNRILQSALTEFRSITGRYPCPADPTLAPGNVIYGIENCGINIVNVGRDANGDTVNDNILVGSFPFDTILPLLDSSDMTATHALDPWKNKYTYVVTENLTNVVTYNDAFGTIRILDEFRESAITPADRAHLLILSHGENGRGGYSANGTLIDPFPVLPIVPPPPPGAMALSEVENANGDGTFLSGLSYAQNSAFPNDDYISYMVNQQSSLWQIVGIDPAFVPPLFFVANTTPGNVGVGVLDPTERLEIDGNVQGQDFRAEMFCDEAGLNCMPLSRIGGNDPEMRCAGGGEAVVAIANNAVVCGTAFAPGPIAPSMCNPATEYMNGFSNLGNAICFPL